MNRRDFLRYGTGLARRRSAADARRSRFPDRPIKLIVPFSPGGATDVVGRLWAERMKAKFGTVVVENKGGGGGVIGATEVARSTPNGETLLFGNTSTQVIIPAIADKPPYDPVKDFQAVYMMAISPTCIVVHESVPAKTLKEFIDIRQGQPDQAVLWLGRRRHHDQPVGRVVQGTDRRAGHHPHPVQGLGAGRDRSRLGPYPDDDAERRRAAAAIPRAPARSASWRSPRTSGSPPRPTSRPPIEAGLPGMVAANFNGLFAPAGVPKDIIKALADETRAAMADPEMQELHDQLGLRAGDRFRARSRAAGGRKRIRALDADHQEDRIQGAVIGEFPMNRRDVLKFGLAASAAALAAPRALRASRVPEPADQARGAVLGRRRERHRRPAMGRADEARCSARSMSRTSAAPAARSASWRCKRADPDGHTVAARQHQHDGAEHHDHEQGGLRSRSRTSCRSRSSASAPPRSRCIRSVPAKNVKELIAYVKANAGKLSYGSAGTGTMSHLSGEMFKLRTGTTDVVHVPYKGAGPGIADLVSGHIPMMSPNVTGQLLRIPQDRQDPHPRDEFAGAAEGRAGHPDRHRARRAEHGRAAFPRHLRAGGDAEAGRRRDLTEATQEGLATTGVREGPDRLRASRPVSVLHGDAALKYMAEEFDALEAGGRRDRAQDELIRTSAAAATRSCASLRSALRSTLLVEASGNSSMNQTKRGC